MGRHQCGPELILVGALAPWNGKVPFYVKLRSYANRPLPEPRELITHAIPALAAYIPTGWVEELLREGQALLLVDGVDEKFLPLSERQSERGLLVTFEGQTSP